MVLGVCGGFQMLGHTIEDPAGVESSCPSVRGLGWLPLVTRFEADKTDAAAGGTGPTGAAVRGYEIRHGRTAAVAGLGGMALARRRVAREGDERRGERVRPGRPGLRDLAARPLRGGPFPGGVPRPRGRGPGQVVEALGRSFAEARERQIDRVADACATHLDTDALWHLVEGACPRRASGTRPARAAHWPSRRSMRVASRLGRPLRSSV